MGIVRFVLPNCKSLSIGIFSGCDKKFTSKFKLKRHILIHSQTKRFLCDVCKRAFRRKDHLKNHEKVHDPGKTVYSCSNKGCSRTYNSISSFRKHQAMHSAEEGQLDCKICKMVLQTQVKDDWTGENYQPEIKQACFRMNWWPTWKFMLGQEPSKDQVIRSFPAIHVKRNSLQGKI